MLLNNTEITMYANQGMIRSFTLSSPSDRLSYGLDPHGYTFRLSPDGMRLLDYGRTLLDPKSTDASAWVSVPSTDAIDIPPGKLVCGWSVEYFVLPHNLTGIIAPKSTYSRLGLLIMGGVLHAGWEGHILVEMINSTSHPIRVYAEEGIATVLFGNGRIATGYDGRYHQQGGH